MLPCTNTSKGAQLLLTFLLLCNQLLQSRVTEHTALIALTVLWDRAQLCGSSAPLNAPLQGFTGLLGPRWLRHKSGPLGGTSGSLSLAVMLELLTHFQTLPSQFSFSHMFSLCHISRSEAELLQCRPPKSQMLKLP